MAAALLRRLHTAPGRLLHPLRRRRALEVLQRRPPPARLLVLCYGNICRSPFAAAVLARDLASAGVRVESAGFIGPGRPCPAEAVTVAAQRGIDLSAHRSTLLTAECLRSADLVVVMDAAQARAVCDRFGRRRDDILVLGDLDPGPITTRAVRDPVDQSMEVFAEAYARIERCAAVLVQVLAPPPQR
jgi:protein-tyrosine-phosphatase